MIQYSTLLLSIVVHFTIFLSTRYILGNTIFRKIFQKLDNVERNRWAERTASFTHSIIATQGSFRALYHLLSKPITVNSFAAPICATADGSEGYLLAEFYMSFTVGYFCYDILLYLTFSPGHEFMDYAHHVISAAQYLINLSFGWGYFVPIFLLTTEISSPFLHLSWFVGKSKDSGVTKFDKLFIPIQIIFALLFLIFRIIFASFIYLLTIKNKIYDELCLKSPAYLTYTSILGFSLFLLVQFVWFKTIFWKFYYVVTGNAEQSWKKKKKEN